MRDPLFFRPRPRLGSLFEHITDSSDTEDRPDTTHYFQRAPRPVPGSYERGRLSGGSISSNPGLSRSASPPGLSFSGTSSVSTSVVSSPMPSPQVRRNGPSLFPTARHLPFPELPPIAGLSRLSLKGEHEAGPSEEPQKSALGLQISPSSRYPSPTPPDTGSHMPPPPYLERTQIALPVPERYWRFDG